GGPPPRQGLRDLQVQPALQGPPALKPAGGRPAAGLYGKAAAMRPFAFPGPWKHAPQPPAFCLQSALHPPAALARRTTVRGDTTMKHRFQVLSLLALAGLSAAAQARSEERRVGKECRYRWWACACHTPSPAPR